MYSEIAYGLLLPFVGTALGAAMVFFLRGEMVSWLQKLLLGFASGVMIAASVWSLLIPSIDMSAEMGLVFKFHGANCVHFFSNYIFNFTKSL